VESAQLSKASAIFKTQTILALIVNQLSILVAANITIGDWRQIQVKSRFFKISYRFSILNCFAPELDTFYLDNI
jgi:hypothetical protein